MFLTLVVLNTRWPDFLWHKQTENTDGKQTRTQPRFFQSETLTFYSFRSLDYARGNESIIYFTDLCKPIETYIYVRKKHPFASYPAAKHPKRSKFSITDMRQKSVEFFIVQHGHRL